MSDKPVPDVGVAVAERTAAPVSGAAPAAAPPGVDGHREKAVAYFMAGYNCAQATAAAFAGDFGLEPATVLAMTAGFGGGIGGTHRDTCGAVSAMVFVAGLKAGSYPPEDGVSKKALYGVVKRMMNDFEDQFGTTCCAELLAKSSCFPAAGPAERNAAYYARRPCARFVDAAAGIIERTITG